ITSQNPRFLSSADSNLSRLRYFPRKIPSPSKTPIFTCSMPWAVRKLRSSAYISSRGKRRCDCTRSSPARGKDRLPTSRCWGRESGASKASLESDRHDLRYTLRCARHAATRRRVRTGRRARTVLVCRGLIANKGEDIRQHGQAPAFGYGEGRHQVTMTGLWEVSGADAAIDGLQCGRPAAGIVRADALIAQTVHEQHRRRIGSDKIDRLRTCKVRCWPEQIVQVRFGKGQKIIGAGQTHDPSKPPLAAPNLLQVLLVESEQHRNVRAGRMADQIQLVRIPTPLARMRTRPGDALRGVLHEAGEFSLGIQGVVRDHGDDAGGSQGGADKFVGRLVAAVPAAA